MTTTTIAFDLVTQLVILFKAKVSSASVLDGPGTVTGEPGNYVLVGVGDPDDDQPAESATGTQEWAGLGARATYEDGAVTCCALAWSGDVDETAQKSVREAVRDMVATIDLACREDPNLAGAVPGLEWVRYGKNYRLIQLADEDGVAALFYFEIAYKARLV